MATAKLAPITISAGHVCRTPRSPSMMNTSRNGTITATNGAWWPTIAPMCVAGMPVSVPAVVMGVPTAPKATGAVFASSTAVAARSGGTPRPSTMVAVMATGAPKPARASSRPPKQNAMSTAWMRMSPPPSESKIARMSSNRPESTVTW